MGTARARPLLSAPLLVLGLGALLTPVGCLQRRPSWRFASSEVVIPLKLSGLDQGRSPGRLSYLLHFGGRRHVVHLQLKKFLLPRHLPVFTYTDRGSVQMDQFFIPQDCYYRGYVEGALGSLAALSTCHGGLQGMLQVNSLYYEIEPLPASSIFQHLVYPMENKKKGPGWKCGLTEEDIDRLVLEKNGLGLSVPRAGPKDNWWPRTRFVELVVVVDNFWYKYAWENETEVIYQVIEVVNIIDSLYYPMSAYISLSGVEIWTNNNPLDFSKGIKVTLDVFSHWKQVINERLPHDVAHLFARYNFGIDKGLAYVGTICHDLTSAAVDAYVEDNLLEFSVTVAHGLGHNLGMIHDRGSCICAQKQCIMYADLGLTDVFSNCSYASYFDRFSEQFIDCLTSLPEPYKIAPTKICGNKVVEEGEECDCGSVKECSKDSCCKPGCTLRPHADCASGLCCVNCKIAPAGTLCRPPRTPCDLPEYCNGTSELCQKDFYMQDGTPCTKNAVCYQSICSDRIQQCKAIFGERAYDAPPICYKQANMIGNQFGNCSLDGHTYSKCDTAHILCGRLQCTNVSQIPHLEKFTTVFQVYVNGVTCFGIDSHMGLEMKDIGYVNNGAVCGQGKICLYKKCVDYSVLNYDCTAKKCNSNGVCNNKKNCHCLSGWDPPFCLKRGFGGSIDSGPPPKWKANYVLIVCCLACLCFGFYGTLIMLIYLARKSAFMI
ncbi:disintegrin and metalloproteinase domain-containing protein 20-like [Dromiciops gliroides]|uniref:disintegrin and metalloproteinase domain-containing protein 20-like n=1 Tax=Dromiciops gliroides TaxID=33562 RepID=UPI001CC58FB1|nr:disintegrin and metalloproteinase domain-containing protein 20-like [Dromiciops gliroides]